MNEWTKIKKRKVVLPEPPQEASQNIQQSAFQPETSTSERKERRYTPRQIKRTGRVVQFATRVTAEFDQQVRTLANQENCYLAEILEKMLVVYLQERGEAN
jgi:hypothetical protein